VTVSPRLTVDELEHLLLGRDLSGVPVVDDGRLVGFVTLSDVVRSRSRGAATVAEIMSLVTFELHESTPMSVAIDRMAVERLHHVPVVDDDRKFVGMVTAIDITRAITRASDVHPHVEEMDRLLSLGFLAGGIAHQANNALTSMRLSLGRLVSFEQSRRPTSPEHQHRVELLQDIREGVARIERIIRELKTFSSAEDGPVTAVDVSALLDAAIGFVAHEIRHRARLVRDFVRVPSVQARASELRQVFINLLVNAAQAIPEGEAHLNEIRVSVRSDADFVVVDIADTGRGIPSEVKGRIFDPFFTTKRLGHGLGLGLALAHDVVEALRGDIQVDSVVGKGTTVRITLPATDAKPRAAMQSILATEVSSRKKRILIVDDDRPVAAAIAFELDTHDVVVAESGREALEILRREKDFDLVLCDLMMPEISGMDVYESLRLTDPSLLKRVVLMTGGAFTARAAQFLAEREPPLLEKPFYSGQLHAVVDALEDHGANSVNERPPVPMDSHQPSKT
jgi:signal transduction histidine kinase/ActR/RegA family two-component response regulator